jgi:NAD(P)-dependent dehydrogenase (short-subunit alcohol dehydrogenase family)
MKKTVVITGASDGVGAEAARALVAHGHHVVIVGRAPDKTRAVAAAIGSDHHVADFAELAQVRQLAGALRDRYVRIDVLANNAGGLFDKARTTDGHDKNFQVNHLAPFLLTNLLIEMLTTSRAAVIQTASRVAKRIGSIDIEDLDHSGTDNTYNAIKAYSDAKLENILFTKELQRRHGPRGISAAAFHPGNVASSFASDTSSSWRFVYNTPLRHVMLISPRRAAQRLVWLAQGQPGQDWQPGEYYEKNKIAPTNPQAADDALAADLWQRSTHMVSLDGSLSPPKT